MPIDSLKEISLKHETSTPQEILRWAWGNYGSGLAMATAFGAEGCAIISMLAEISKDIYIFNLDTGYQFPETMETCDRIIKKYGVNIHLIQPEQSVEAMESEHGGPIYGSDPNLCCHIRKVVPLRKALEGKTAWISAIRRDQAITRVNTPIIDWDQRHNLVKINPLANWTKRDVWGYILENNVPYNPLHDYGYPSIGCKPCTHPVDEGADERSGRWAGSTKIECGLHYATSEQHG